MDYKIKYRPTIPAQVIGETQREIAQTLFDLYDKGQIKQKLLFTGPSGVGKTTLARMYVSKIAPNSQIIELDGTNLNTDGIRQILSEMQYAPLVGLYRVYFIDEFHGLTKAQQRLFLTELEEKLKPTVLIIAASSEEHKVIKEIYDRFSFYRLETPNTAHLAALLKSIYKKEQGHDIPLEDLEAIISSVQGSVREAVEKLQQYVEGTFKPIKIIEEDDDLAKVFFKESFSVQKVLSKINKETDYHGVVISLCHYAIKIISSKQHKRAETFIKVFGEGLSKDVPPKVSFVNKLLIYGDLINAKPGIIKT